jgi:hypothetical protein
MGRWRLRQRSDAQRLLNVIDIKPDVRLRGFDPSAQAVWRQPRYVAAQRAYLSGDGANVVVAIEGAERARVPIHTLSGLVNFGWVALSPPCT